MFQKAADSAEKVRKLRKKDFNGKPKPCVKREKSDLKKRFWTNGAIAGKNIVCYIIIKQMHTKILWSIKVNKLSRPLQH